MTKTCMCMFTCARHSTLVEVREQLVRAGSLLPRGHRGETQTVMVSKRTYLLSHPRQPLPSLCTAESRTSLASLSDTLCLCPILVSSAPRKQGLHLHPGMPPMYLTEETGPGALGFQKLPEGGGGDNSNRSQACTNSNGQILGPHQGHAS